MMKRMMIAATLCIVSFSLYAAAPWDGVSVAASFAGGDGTRANPYLIGTPAELAYLGKQVNENAQSFAGKYLKLTADIDLNRKAWTPIGTHEVANTPENDAPFNGHFDGDGHVVYNLAVDLPERAEVGLFGYIEGDTIQNLGIAGHSTINGTASVGALSGKMYSSAGKPASVVLNCFSNAQVTGSDVNVGGLIGFIYVNNVSASGSAYVLNSYTRGSVSGKNFVGGIVGSTGSKNRTLLYNCYTTATVSAAEGVAYGIVTKGSGKMTMLHCYFLEGEVTNASTGVSMQRTEEEMKAAGFIDELNMELSAAAWKADYANPINEGYPILGWQADPGESTDVASQTVEGIAIETSGQTIQVRIAGEKNVSVKLYDTTGRCIGEETSASRLVSFRVSHKGLYLAAVNVDGKSIVKKVLLY